MMRYFSSLIALLLLTFSPLFTDSGTYQGPIDGGSWNDDVNWNPGPFPNGNDDVATFAASVTNLSLGQDITVQGISIQDPNFTVALSEATDQTLSFSTANGEVTLNQGTLSVGSNVALSAQETAELNFDVDSNLNLVADGSTIDFTNAATTFNGGNLTNFADDRIINFGTNGSNNVVSFQNGSTLTQSGGAYIDFRGGNNTFAALATLSIDSATGGNIEFYGTSQNLFQGAVSLSSTDVNSLLLLYGQSQNTFAASSTLTVEAAATGSIHFFGNSVNSFSGTVSNASTAGGDVLFYGNSQNTFAASSTLTVEAAATGSIQFSENSINSFSGAVSNASTAGGSVLFAASSENTFAVGSTLTLEAGATGTIQFLEDSVNSFSGLVSNASTESFFSFSGNSQNTFGNGASLVKNSSGQFRFLGSSVNSFEAGSTINLTQVADENSLVFSGNSTTTMTGDAINPMITGEGKIEIRENATLSISTTPFAGNFEITVLDNALLDCSSFFLPGTLLNDGNVQLSGLSTTVIAGQYQQSADGRLIIGLNSEDSSSLFLTAPSSIDGTLQIDAANGTYQTGTQYTIINTNDQIITGEFATVVSNSDSLWSVSYPGTQVLITLLESAAVLPEPINAIPSGNSRNVADYLFSDPSFDFFNSDIAFVTNTLAQMDVATFESSLVKISPLTSAAIPLAGLRNSVEMAVVLDKQFNTKVQKKVQRKRAKAVQRGELLCSALPKTGWFIEPIALFYNQRQVGGSLVESGQIGFEALTYGFGTGWEQMIGEHFVFEAGAGYTHSNLKWDDEFGHVNWSSIYLAPFGGWYNDTFYANIMVMGALNLNYSSRNIRFPGIDRTAKADYLSYDILLRANGGARFHIDNGFWIQPDGTVNFLTTLTEGYSERGADSLNLQVRHNDNYVLQPSIRAKLIKDFQSARLCFNPNLYVGYLANILLNSQNFSSRLAEAPNQILFNTTGYYKTTHQLVLGAEYYMENPEKFLLSSTFEVDMLSKIEVYSLKVKFQLFF